MSKSLNALMMMTTGLINEEEQKEYSKIIEKSLKALEIIFSKRVDADEIIESQCYEEYIEKVEELFDKVVAPKLPKHLTREWWLEKWLLTKEEYELVAGVYKWN